MLLYMQEPQLAHQKEKPTSKVTLGYEGGAEMGQPCEKSKVSSQSKTFGGYVCEFVEPPPSIFVLAPECRDIETALYDRTSVRLYVRL